MIHVRSRHSCLALVVLAGALIALVAVPASAEAQKKKKKVKTACGLKVLPLAEGTEWTYQYFVPEGDELPTSRCPFRP